jgi:hypothetical protein
MKYRMPWKRNHSRVIGRSALLIGAVAAAVVARMAGHDVKRYVRLKTM